MNRPAGSGSTPGRSKWARADLLLINPDHLRAQISEQVEIRDQALDGAIRMVKRGSERIIEAVYINGRLAARNGAPAESLGRERMGTSCASPGRSTSKRSSG